MKKIIAAIFVIAFLFASIDIQSAIYYSPTGKWYGPDGQTVGRGRHAGHTVTVGTGGIESVSVSCNDETEWICWSINGDELWIDPIQTGPGDRIDMIFTN
ncbi:MAG: hypothetical protein KGZ71_10035 [Desulfobulbaceae bacterium]|nr:hypothetical protein [Candidatus Kapabacteria bacterium]MBS4000807.1 hypothetical protein [Desulfobulbaceae bacterium]